MGDAGPTSCNAWIGGSSHHEPWLGRDIHTLILVDDLDIVLRRVQGPMGGCSLLERSQDKWAFLELNVLLWGSRCLIIGHIRGRDPLLVLRLLLLQVFKGVIVHILGNDELHHIEDKADYDLELLVGSRVLQCVHIAFIEVLFIDLHEITNIMDMGTFKDFLFDSIHFLRELVYIFGDKGLDPFPLEELRLNGLFSESIHQLAKHPSSLEYILLRLLDSSQLHKETQVQLSKGIQHLLFLGVVLLHVLLGDLVYLLLNHLFIGLHWVFHFSLLGLLISIVYRVNSLDCLLLADIIINCEGAGNVSNLPRDIRLLHTLEGSLSVEHRIGNRPWKALVCGVSFILLDPWLILCFYHLLRWLELLR